MSRVLATVRACGADPTRLTLELTESMWVHDVDDLIGKMGELKREGISFALDDFGLGYSSLNILKRLPLDQLKIDRSFVGTVLTDEIDAAIANMVLALGRTLHLEVVAEGVETEEQWAYLSTSGCDLAQGYLFDPPLPLASFEVNAHARLSKGVIVPLLTARRAYS